ncbi:MAG TPA: class I SAM-dependent methyltransferase [Solirubrobacteraceae bacterium]|jgi:ubiquinone/menaquinone biosynthesis C-methylase UbiE|nr:class I SAM-dependent methyltransferase [Solirubrobacteraceae bacterium]
MDIDQFKQAQRFVWGLGDYPSFARLLDGAAKLTVERAGVSEGERVLDVATGTGNAALWAARAGAHVTGLDLSPQLLGLARARAETEGVEIDWVEGDAESLPFADGEFDRVLSVFGAIFAPRHVPTGAELLRVTRPGGTVALTSWVPEGVMGQMIAMPFIPPPPDAQSPVLWGDEAHAREMLAAAAQVSVEPGTVSVVDESVEHYVANLAENLGPLVAARAALEPSGRWPEARAQLHELYAEANGADDGSMAIDIPYLLILAQA